MRKTGTLLIILAGIMICFGGFLLSNASHESKKDKDNKKEEKKEMTIPDYFNLTLFKADNLVYILYDEYGVTNWISEADTIKEHIDPTYDSIRNDLRLALAFHYMDYDKSEEKTVKNKENCTFPEECTKKEVPDKNFEATYKKIFGLDKEVKYEDFYVDDYSCKHENNVFKCTEVNKFLGYEHSFFLLESETSTDDEIVLRVNRLYYSDSESYNLSNSENGLYDTFGGKLIASQNDVKGITLDEEKIFKSVDYNVLFETYKGKTKDYDVTFKKDTNGNFYWFSTKAVN